MKRSMTSALILITLVMSGFAGLVTALDFLALHDVWQDYVSRQVIAACCSDLSGKLPEWSETKQEWHLINISVGVRILYLLFSSITLVVCYRALRARNNK